VCQLFLYTTNIEGKRKEKIMAINYIAPAPILLPPQVVLIASITPQKTLIKSKNQKVFHLPFFAKWVIYCAATYH
jgi:exonuclease I